MNIDASKWKKNKDADSDSICLDVRTSEEFNEGHINNSVNVDFYNAAKFISFLGDLDKNNSYYIYCRSGKRSYSACEIMSELGFKNLYNLESGYLGWLECGYETIR